MFAWITQLSFAQLAWLAPIAHILHYAEEGPRLVEWFNNHYLPGKPMKVPLHYTQKKLNLENALLLTVSILTVILFNIYPDSLILQVMVVASGFGLVGNTFFHAIPTLRTAIYSPGVVTASMIFPPVLYIFLWKMSQEGILTLPITIAALIVGNLMLPIMVIVVHKWILSD